MDSFIKWIGGKRLLRKRILEEFPEEGSYDRYIEAFGGAGWILFAKEKHASLEVYNNMNGNLVNLFRCVKLHEKALEEELKWCLTSRELFHDALAQVDIRGMTDLQRAARFYLIIKCSFGAKLTMFTGTRAVLEEHKIAVSLERAHERLQRIVIENRDFDKIIKVYDRDRALFYLDPPYYQTERYYGVPFGEADHLRLKAAVKDIKGKFVLSYNDDAFIRELYQEYQVIPVERNNNMSPGNSFKELIIKNF